MNALGGIKDPEYEEKMKVRFAAMKSELERERDDLNKKLLED